MTNAERIERARETVARLPHFGSWKSRCYLPLILEHGDKITGTFIYRTDYGRLSVWSVEIDENGDMNLGYPFAAYSNDAARREFQYAVDPRP